ncbi:MAG: hypothetical protein OXE99_08840 [Cellvibrionales bacterium]|nr:hypothetical protein [Cellvibrionales bacterium]
MEEPPFNQDLIFTVGDNSAFQSVDCSTSCTTSKKVFFVNGFLSQQGMVQEKNSSESVSVKIVEKEVCPSAMSIPRRKRNDDSGCWSYSSGSSLAFESGAALTIDLSNPAKNPVISSAVSYFDGVNDGKLADKSISPDKIVYLAKQKNLNGKGVFLNKAIIFDCKSQNMSTVDFDSKEFLCKIKGDGPEQQVNFKLKFSSRLLDNSFLMSLAGLVAKARDESAFDNLVESEAVDWETKSYSAAFVGGENISLTLKLLVKTGCGD